LREKSLFQLKGLLKEIGYDALINRLEKSAVERQDKSMAAGHAAKNIINVIAKPKLKASYLIGRDAKLLSRLQRILPYSLFEKLIMKKIGLPQMN